MVIVSNLSNEPTDLTEIVSLVAGSSVRVICVLLSPLRVKSTFGSKINPFLTTNRLVSSGTLSLSTVPTGVNIFWSPADNIHLGLADTNVCG